MAFLLSSILLGCNQDFNSIEKSRFDHYSGEDLFKGIFFSKGEIAEMIPVIKNSRTFYDVEKYTNQTEGFEEFEKATNGIVENIKTKNPSYFSNFGRVIKSKNHILIQQSLLEGAELVYSSMVDEFLTDLGEKELEELIGNIEVSDHLNPDGSVNYDSLKEVLSSSKINDAISNESKAMCAVLGPVFVAVAYLLVIHAASVATYVYLAWVYNSYAAIETGENSARINEITLERMVNDLAN